MYLLDTNTISDGLKPKPNSGLVHFLESQAEDLLFISNVSIAEIAFGIQLLPEGNRKQSLNAHLEALIVDFEERLLDVTTSIAVLYGSLHAQQKKAGFNDNVFDALIIATAQQHNLIIVTRNEKDFQNRGVKVLNPYR